LEPQALRFQFFKDLGNVHILPPSEIAIFFSRLVEIAGGSFDCPQYTPRFSLRYPLTSRIMTY